MEVLQAVLVFIVLLASPSFNNAQQQQQQFNSFDNGMGKFQHNFKNGFGLGNMDGAGGQFQQDPMSMGIGNPGAQQQFGGGGNRVPGGGNVNGGGGRLQLSNGNNGRPNEGSSSSAPPSSSPPPQEPKIPRTVISIGVPLSQTQASQSSPFSAPPTSNSNNFGQHQSTLQPFQGSKEESHQSHTNTNKFTTFPQSNSIGMPVYNSDLSPTLAKNTFGMPSLNSWNTKSNLENTNGGGGGDGSFNAHNIGQNNNRFKVGSLKDGGAGFSKNALDFNFRKPQNQNPNNNMGLLKFPTTQEEFPSMIQDNRFGPSNDGFGNTPVNNVPKNQQNTVKQGSFSWTSPEGEVYEVSYVADASKTSTLINKGQQKQQQPQQQKFNTNNMNQQQQTQFPAPMPQFTRNNLDQFGAGTANVFNIASPQTLRPGFIHFNNNLNRFRSSQLFGGTGGQLRF